MVRFRARLDIAGVNSFVPVPAWVSRHFGRRGCVPVVVHVGMGRIASNLVPIGGGAHRLYINRAMLRHTESRVGDMLSVGLEMDESDRSLKVPAEMRAELNASPVALARWHSFAPSKRHEITRYILSGKTSATRLRNIAKLMKILEAAAGEGVLCGISIPVLSANSKTQTKA